MNYKYYVYVRPGEIYYFDNYQKAKEFAADYPHTSVEIIE